MQLIRNPVHYDVIVAENMFGDILTDEASVLAGSMGMLPSASLAGLPDPKSRRKRPISLYEPIHGSAPDIAGKGIANPIGQIWSAAMMLDHLGQSEAAAGIVAAIETVLKDSDVKTPDMGGKATTAELGRAVEEAL
jgi:tartrate dehydrogenase/decarboxylase/D-malate dehydrogenase